MGSDIQQPDEIYIHIYFIFPLQESKEVREIDKDFDDSMFKRIFCERWQWYIVSCPCLFFNPLLIQFPCLILIVYSSSSSVWASSVSEHNMVSHIELCTNRIQLLDSFLENCKNPRGIFRGFSSISPKVLDRNPSKSVWHLF